MNKTLKFRHHFIDAILKKDRITTTRLFDDKDLSVGDVVDFLNDETGEKFAIGKITKINETSFEKMIEDAADSKGLHKMYEEYYGRTVNMDDRVKWIDFELI